MNNKVRVRWLQQHCIIALLGKVCSANEQRRVSFTECFLNSQTLRNYRKAAKCFSNEEKCCNKSKCS